MEQHSTGEPIHVGGTLIWYYCICKRQTWLMAHQINPDEDDPNLEYGRFLHEKAYPRQRNEVELGANKLDIVTSDDGQVVVVEVKKSSRHLESARMQLAHYLLSLEELGVSAQGEIRVPDERKRERIVLDNGLRQKVEQMRKQIQALVHRPIPPARRIPWCKKCAYAEMCWS